MILPQSSVGVLIVMILGMACLGLWANFLKLASGRLRFELFYFDFAVGAGIAALLFGLTLGNLGYDGFSLLDDLSKAGKRQWMLALVAGVVFSLANELLVAAISVAGMSVAFPLALGVALLGTVLIGEGAANSLFVTAGCVLVALAILAGMIAHAQSMTARAAAYRKDGRKGRAPGAAKGILLALASGLLLRLFVPVLQTARAGELGLVPYSTTILFCAGLFFSSLLFNLFFMNLPVEGDPVEILDLFKVVPKLHLLGLLGGIFWCAGFLAMQAAVSTDPALRPTRSMNLGFTYGVALLAGLCGLAVWREFREAPGRAKAMAFVTLLLFGGGLALLARALEA